MSMYLRMIPKDVPVRMSLRMVPLGCMLRMCTPLGVPEVARVRMVGVAASVTVSDGAIGSVRLRV